MGAPFGNQNARKRPFREVLDRIIAQEDGKRLRFAGEKLFDAAAQGEPWAVKELADRTDGKPTQAIEATGSITIVIQSEDADVL